MSLVELSPTNADFRNQLAGVDQQIGILRGITAGPTSASPPTRSCVGWRGWPPASRPTSDCTDLAACMTAIGPSVTVRPARRSAERARGGPRGARRTPGRPAPAAPRSRRSRPGPRRRSRSSWRSSTSPGRPRRRSSGASDLGRPDRPACHRARVPARAGRVRPDRRRPARRAGQPRAALVAYNEARAITVTLVRDGPESQTIQVERATIERRLGEALEHAGQHAEATAALRRSITILAGLSHLGAGDLCELAAAHAALAGSGVPADEGPTQAEAATSSALRGHRRRLSRPPVPSPRPAPSTSSAVGATSPRSWPTSSSRPTPSPSLRPARAPPPRP